MIETVYKTKDGCTFQSEAHAEQHSQRLFERWLDEDLPKITVTQMLNLAEEDEPCEEIQSHSESEYDILYRLIWQMYNRTVKNVSYLEPIDFIPK